MTTFVEIWTACAVLNVLIMAVVDGKKGTRNVQRSGIAAVIFAPLMTVIILGTLLGRILR